MKKGRIIVVLLVAALTVLIYKHYELHAQEKVIKKDTSLCIIHSEKNHNYLFVTIRYNGHEYVLWHDRCFRECGGILHSPDCPCLIRYQ